jgi:hypothetical protein
MAGMVFCIYLRSQKTTNMIRSTFILLFALLFTANATFAHGRHGKCCKSEVSKSCCEKKVTKCVTKTSCCDSKWNNDDHSVCCAKPHSCDKCYKGCNERKACAPHSCCFDYKETPREHCAPHSCEYCYTACK